MHTCADFLNTHLLVIPKPQNSVNRMTPTDVSQVRADFKCNPLLQHAYDVTHAHIITFRLRTGELGFDFR
jgi:hypothetical protein